MCASYCSILCHVYTVSINENKIKFLSLYKSDKVKQSERAHSVYYYY